MPCMCGDPYCGSCGPAQGNDRCEICGKWSWDGGCADPKACDAKAEEWAKAMDEAEAKMERMEEEARLVR